MSLEERVLRVPEAAALIGVASSTYYAAVRRGEVPGFRCGRRWVVPGAQLARLLEGGVAMANTTVGINGAPTRRVAK